MLVALPSDEDGSRRYQLVRPNAANGEAQSGQQVMKEYQKIQKSKSTPMESVETEVPNYGADELSLIPES